jgi:hypothetical protein
MFSYFSQESFLWNDGKKYLSFVSYVLMKSVFTVRQNFMKHKLNLLKASSQNDGWKKNDSNTNSMISWSKLQFHMITVDKSVLRPTSFAYHVSKIYFWDYFGATSLTQVFILSIAVSIFNRNYVITWVSSWA